MNPPLWRLWVDTGGTFTDCVAVDLAGRTHRLKVLSSSALRGRLGERVGEGSWRVDAGWAAAAAADLFRGYAFRLLEVDSPVLAVRGSESGGPSLRLDQLPGSFSPDLLSIGTPFELLSHEEAPVLAARLVTGTPLDRPLPPIAMRLATTRGTNALLERKGAKTALFITRGFADLLEIGTQQRPDLFALDIRKPPPLYAAAVEVTERLAADGAVLVPLDLAALEEEVARLLADGFDAAAVALLHSYREPRHEEALAVWLAARGFRHVARSAALAPRIQLLPRATTAVVDAYLAPAIGEYLERVAAALPGGTLHVLTSAGALAGTATFRPKDSLLSGPAGGVVGAALAGRRSGLARVIAFDVGGTSTDVARWDGAFEVVFEHRVGDAWLVAPALAIESVAAGGGSICRFDGTQLKVGPESAGAAPGPACYGAGGPLTLTDVNLLLGRLDPRCFGIPLVVEAAERVFAVLAEEVRQAEGGGGQAPAREALLAGLLAIADERTADAIRTISVRRGIDPADYALVAFGGAGGQHACAVAELLGIGTVLVPADAGLLSALGLGAAAVERFAQRQVLEPLAAAAAERLPALLAELEEEARAAVAAEGVAREEIAVTRRLLHLRFLGQDATVAVEHDAAVPVEEAFAAAYRALFGYAPEGRGVELESVHVAAASRAAEPEPPLPQPPPREAPAPASRRAWFDGWREVPAYDREALAPGARFAGPALVFEAHATTVVPAGWAGSVDGAGGLLLARS